MQSKWQDVDSLAELLLLVRLVSLIVLVLTLELNILLRGLNFSGDPRSNLDLDRKFLNADLGALVHTSRCGGAREMGGCGRPAWVRRVEQ
jgi:hypothetical protein